MYCNELTCQTCMEIVIIDQRDVSVRREVYYAKNEHDDDVDVHVFSLSSVTMNNTEDVQTNVPSICRLYFFLRQTMEVNRDMVKMAEYRWVYYH